MLDKAKTKIVDERNSRKAPLSDVEARKLLATVERVIVAKGQAARHLKADETTLEDLRGPTGNFRAPMIRKGKTLLVGFSDAAIRQLLS
ncbi:MAG: hypothetical protein HY304_04790 [candidate division Zixibacteria bacterium]|nr:hypothetical protein [candidate division Zixibacteria bacterium]